MKRADYFRDFGDGSFRAVQFWVTENDGIHTLYTANTVFEWKDVQGVQSWATPNPLPEDKTPDGAKCVLFWLNVEIKILAPFSDVAKAWRDYRNRAHLPTIGAN